MAFKNVVDDTSTTVSASTPGVTVQLTNHTTHRLRYVGVPVRFKVCVNTTAANDTGAVKLVDSTGTPVITVLCNNPAATTSPIGDWYWADGYLPATEAKYDVHYGGNTSGSLTVFSASAYEIDWTTDPVTGSASMTLGAMTVVSTGGFSGDAALTLGGMTVSAIGDGHGDAALTLGALTVAADGTVASPAPVYQAIGTQVGGSGAVSPAWPVGAHAVDDIAILIAVSNDAFSDPGAATLSVAAGFTAVTGGADSSTDGSAFSRVTLFWCRATSTTMATPTVAAAAGDNSAVIVTFRGCTTSGDPYDGASVAANASENSAVSVAGVTTAGTNRAVLVAIGHDNTAATCASYTNANLTSITERIDAAATLRLVAATATAAAAGNYGSTTATLSGNALWAAATVALKP